MPRTCPVPARAPRPRAAPNAIRSSSEYNGSSTRSCATIAIRNHARIFTTVGPGKLANHPAIAAPAISRLAASAVRCSGLAPYSRRNRAVIDYTRSNVIVPAHLVQWTPGMPGPITRAG